MTIWGGWGRSLFLCNTLASPRSTEANHEKLQSGQ
jgi:hypothetical protein